MEHSELKYLLDELHEQYNSTEFIPCDPVSIPHTFVKKEDIEISGFLTALISWGQRAQIIRNAMTLMQLMDQQPFDFVVHASEQELRRLDKFYYRTLKPIDIRFLVFGLRKIYREQSGLEGLFTRNYLENKSVKEAIVALYSYFDSLNHQQRSMKHIANVGKGASAKRINMFLRWMVRSDNRGVDFGLWKNIPASALYIPIDVHSGNTARELMLLTRKQNDWKAVEELTSALKLLDPEDPIKYDFALFGAGVTRAEKKTSRNQGGF